MQQHRRRRDLRRVGFSALQRAENSSINALLAALRLRIEEFQCSSASRKFLNTTSPPPTAPGWPVSVLFSEPKIPQSVGVAVRRCELDGFSALQRAENSSMVRLAQTLRGGVGFSALQRAENSSIQTLAPASIHISDRDDHASSFLSLPGASP